MNTKIIPLALVGLLIAAGLGLKVDRYAGQFEDRQAEDLKRIAAFLAPGGWSPVPHDGRPLPFAFVTLAKPGCGAKLIVAPLGSSHELIDEVRLALGPDLAFVETSKGQPSRLAGLLGQAENQLGLLAVSPAPGSATAGCQTPSLARWREI